MKQTFYKTNAILFIIILLATFSSCSVDKSKLQANSQNAGDKKIAVLMVNHGSRSATWRNALLQLEKEVTDSILAISGISGLKTAFMEYTEPSIATRLKELDNEGFTDVIIVPVFLTVSPHSFDDIPTIVGLKEDPESAEMLKLEKIERYTPRATVHITPLLDFTNIIRENILRRTEELSKMPEKEGLVLIAYGDEEYEKEWSDLLNKVGNYIKEKKGITAHSHGWCGHIAHYNPDSTTNAINKVLKIKEKALVVPVLVAHDEMFQVKIIGDGIAKIENNKQRVTYKPDAILPDANVENWVISVAKEYAEKIKNGETLANNK